MQPPAGPIYQLVGGAPLKVGDCSVVRNCQPLYHVDNLDKFLAVPRDGTVLYAQGDYFIVAGGAPIYLDNCDSVGCPNRPSVEKWTIQVHDHLNKVPADGTCVKELSDYFVVAGGAPVYLDNYDFAQAICPHSITITRNALANISGYVAQGDTYHNSFNMVPADGTCVREPNDYFVVAGGAPIYINSYDFAQATCPHAVKVTHDALVNIAEYAPKGDTYHNHFNMVPADGTCLREPNDYFVVAGGAPVYLDSLNGINCPSVVTITHDSLTNIQGYVAQGDTYHNHFALVPADGTVLDDQTYRYVVAGGAPIYLGGCTLGPDCGRAVRITRDAVGNTKGYLDKGDTYHNHFALVPADGTVLYGAPSQQYWTVTGGCLLAISPANAAVQVDDNGLAKLPQCSSPTNTATTPPTGTPVATATALPTVAPSTDCTTVAGNQLLHNCGFEQQSAQDCGPGHSGVNYCYTPASSAWTFDSHAGISGNGSAETGGNPSAPQGQQVAFLEGPGSFSQSLGGLQPGASYSLTFASAQRGNAGPSAQSFKVYLDTQLLANVTPGGTSYEYSGPYTFTATAATQTLRFVGTTSYTAFVDNVIVTRS